jgi:hypothetical protein
MEKKIIHIIVEDGLVQTVFAEGVDCEIVIHDLDNDSLDERKEVEREINDLRYFAKQVY